MSRPYRISLRRPFAVALLHRSLAAAAAMATACAASSQTDETTSGPDVDSSGSAAGTSTGGDPVPGATTSSGAGETAADTSGSDSAGSDTGDGVGAMCDVWAQDCPEMQKCAPIDAEGDGVFETAACVPLVANPLAIGDPCMQMGTGQGVDACDIGAICLYDPITDAQSCAELCTGSADAPMCSKQTDLCLPASEALYECVAKCDPLADDCPAENQGCLFEAELQGGFCFPVGDNVEGQDCFYGNDCVAGQYCLDAPMLSDCTAEACCTSFCDVTQPDTCPQAPAEQCVSVWDGATPAPGYENVGVCRLPP